MCRFIGWGSGLFKALFQSVSAFCNAGFDLVGSNSMIPFVTHRITNITCMFLITIGGLGFLVWDDISNCIKKAIKEKLNFGRFLRSLSLHTKLVLTLQLVLVIMGTIAFFACEYDNIATMANFNLSDKLLISTFHSVSARTAGFATVDLSCLNDITKFIMIFLMLIGGAPGGMAGGLKTTTILVIILGVLTNIKGKKNISILKRTITDGTFIKAVSVVVIALVLLMLSNMFLIANSDINVLDIMFESTSAFATVGLTSGALSQMNAICQGLIILLMFVGRVGTTTMAVAFVMKKPRENDLVVYAKENVIVG